jgi:hypothetical protein
MSRKTTIAELYKKWREKYLLDLKKESKGEKNYADMVFIGNHIKFIKNYLQFFLLNGNTLQNVRRVKRFLKMQTFKIPKNLMEFYFINGKPRDIVLNARSKKDLNIADIYSLLKFEMIIVKRAKRRKWTNQIVKTIIREIENDFELDGYESEIRHKTNGTDLTIYCNIKK